MKGLSVEQRYVVVMMWETTSDASNIGEVKRLMGKAGWRFMFNAVDRAKYPNGSPGSKCVCPACSKAQHERQRSSR